MATLDLESSGDSGGYSDSFELEESISLDPVESSTESETKNAVISQLKKTLNNHTSVGTRKTTQVPEPINRKQAGTKSASTSTSRNGICNKINVDGGSNIDLGMTIRSPMKLDCSDEAKELPQPNNSKFKKVAQNVTTMQSVVNTAKNFNDSLEVRDSVYSEWLARKKTQVSREASSKITAKKVEEEAKRKKEVELAQRSAKAVQSWSATKEIQLKRSRKNKEEEMKKVKEEAKEIEEKKQAAEVASKKWREEKTRQLVGQLRQKKKKELEEIKRKEEENTEKGQCASQAFEVWSKRKDERIKSERQKQREQRRQQQMTKTEQERQRKEESNKAFEAWKHNKDEKLSSTKTLYTYIDDGKRRVHERSWCPARSVKYTYPKHKTTNGKAKKAKQKEAGSTSFDASYSSTSFESTDVDSGSESDSFIVDEDRASAVSSGVNGGTRSKGVRKAIQVCCQTLEYWCTCDHDL